MVPKIQGPKSCEFGPLSDNEFINFPVEVFQKGREIPTPRKMKTLITICILFLAILNSPAEESPVEVAKRVIADKSQAFTLIDLGITGVTSADRRDPRDDEFAIASKEAEAAMVAYMLGDSVPEMVRVAYAIRVLASKRVRTTGFHPLGLDEEKNEQFLKDGLTLANRLAELKEAKTGNDLKKKTDVSKSQ